MIGAALAIFYFVTGKDMLSGESFSIKFSANVVTGNASAVPAEVYFCTGNNCEYYEQIYADYGADSDLPDFFALVGIDAGSGKKVLSELTLGWYFEFQDGVLTTCNSILEEDEEETDFDPLEVAKQMAGSAKMSSFDIGTVIDFGDAGSVTITDHDVGFDPDVHSAAVLGLKMPTPEDCGALAPLPTPDPIDPSIVVDVNTDPSTWPTFSEPVDPDSGRRLSQVDQSEIDPSERRLWGRATASTSHELWYAANGAYNGDTSGKFYPWSICVNDNQRAQFFYGCDYRGCNMILGFAGSDDVKDWMQNAQIWPGGPFNKYHSGFYDYQNGLSGCIKRNKDLLLSWGISLDYIVGHSLGGAAAVVYAQEHGNANKGVVTFGAPKTNIRTFNGWWGWTAHYPDVKGWRFMHSDDPVTSNMCFAGCIMYPHSHVVSSVFEYQDKWVKIKSTEKTRKKSCGSSWWRRLWCWFEDIIRIIFRRELRKIIKSQSVRHCYNYRSIIWAAYGALLKHSAYGDYPSVNL